MLQLALRDVGVLEPALLDVGWTLRGVLALLDAGWTLRLRCVLALQIHGDGYRAPCIKDVEMLEDLFNRFDPGLFDFFFTLDLLVWGVLTC